MRPEFTLKQMAQRIAETPEGIEHAKVAIAGKASELLDEASRLTGHLQAIRKQLDQLRAKAEGMGCSEELLAQITEAEAAIERDLEQGVVSTVE